MVHPIVLSIATIIGILFGWYSMKYRYLIASCRYRFSEWAFRWVSDESGDIGLRLFGVLTLLKYKDSTLFYWFRRFKQAEKWHGHESPK